MTARALERLEALLTGIYDLDIGCRVGDFLVTDRALLPGECRDAPGDEQLFVAAAATSSACRSTSIRRCSSAWTATTRASASTRGTSPTAGPRSRAISHFLCVAHNAGHDRPVSRLALEMQAEIDKYVACVVLLRRRQPRRFPAELHALLFRHARIDPALAGPPRVPVPPRQPPGGALLRPARAAPARPVPARRRRLARRPPPVLPPERPRQAPAHRCGLRRVLGPACAKIRCRPGERPRDHQPHLRSRVPTRPGHRRRLRRLAPGPRAGRARLRGFPRGQHRGARDAAGRAPAAARALPRRERRGARPLPRERRDAPPDRDGAALRRARALRAARVQAAPRARAARRTSRGAASTAARSSPASTARSAARPRTCTCCR